MSACEHPIPKLQIIRMIRVGQAERGQAPGVLQIGIEREAVVFERQGRPMAEDFHSAVKILPESGLEVLAPAGRFGR